MSRLWDGGSTLSRYVGMQPVLVLALSSPLRELPAEITPGTSNDTALPQARQKASAAAEMLALPVATLI